MKTGKRLLTIILTLVLCIGMLPTTVNAASTFKTSSTSTVYYYTFKNVGTSKYLNVKGNSSANNANITLWQKDGTSGQNFALYYDSTNKGYVIVPECSTSRAVNIYGSSAGAGKNICTWTKTGHSTQAWILKSVSGGYIIQSANNTNYVLTASGSSNGSNICIQKYSSSNKNQVWTLSLSKTISTKATLSSSSMSVNAGSSSTMKATFSGPGIASISCTSSNTSVCTASISSTSWASAGSNCSTSIKVTGKKAGSAKVTLYLKDSSGKSLLSKSFTVTVKGTSSTVSSSISFSQSSVSMKTGGSSTVTASFQGTGITYQDIEVSNSNVVSCEITNATVNTSTWKGSSSIKLTAKSAGTATVTYYLYDSDASLLCSKSITVTVKNDSSVSKTLSINWTYINGTGKQTVSGPCLCYSLAYCRDILDGKTHYWTEYRLNKNSYAGVASKASYTKKTSKSTNTVYKAIYEQLKAGKPVVIRVGYLKGRSSGTHYVTVVGYTNVTDTSKLSASNFIIIDPLIGNKTENMGTVGYSLGKDSGYYSYYVAT